MDRLYLKVLIKVICLIMMLPVVLIAQEPENEEYAEYPLLKADKEIIKYDTILQYSNTTRRVTITNEGNIALKIFNIRSSCGVSVPSWPREPIDPGEEGAIQMRYDASHPGPVKRNLIIHSNSPGNTLIIEISGYVIPNNATSAPN